MIRYENSLNFCIKIILVQYDIITSERKKTHLFTLVRGRGERITLFLILKVVPQNTSPVI